MRGPLTHIIIHHTAAEEKDAEQIRAYHKSVGYQDIAYDFVIEKDGKVVTGRSLGIKGAHAGVDYHNNHSIGIVVIGNMMRRAPYPEQLLALETLLTGLMKKYNIPVDNILKHSDIKATNCPGTLFPVKDLIEKLRREGMINFEVNGKKFYPEKVLLMEGQTSITVRDFLRIVGIDLDAMLHVRLLKLCGKTVEYDYDTHTVKIS